MRKKPAAAIHWLVVGLLVALFLWRQSSCIAALDATDEHGNRKPSSIAKKSLPIFKKLTPIEISENVPIGYTIVDLKSKLLDQYKYAEDVYFHFELISDMNLSAPPPPPPPAPLQPLHPPQHQYQHQYQHQFQHNQNHQQQHDQNPHQHAANNRFDSEAMLSASILSSAYDLRTYFLLDSYTGTIQTSKSLDLESLCDLNLCQSRQHEVDAYEAYEAYEISPQRSQGFVEDRRGDAISQALASGLDVSSKESCIIAFKVKASRFIHRNSSSSGSGSSSSAMRDSVYHISFDLIIKDLNEYKPQFEPRPPLKFNVTEEIYPIRLPLGSVAYDNDCTDRGSLVYKVNVLRVNNKPYAVGGETANIVIDAEAKANSNVNFNSNINPNGSLSSSVGQASVLGLSAVADQDQTLLFLHIDKPFDRELIQSVELEVIASDDHDNRNSNGNGNGNGHAAASQTLFENSFSDEGGEKWPDRLLVQLSIVDVNDNTPRFDSQLYNLEFDEGLAANTELIRLRALDADTGANGEVRYELALLDASAAGGGGGSGRGGGSGSGGGATAAAAFISAGGTNVDLRDTFYVHPISGALMLKKRLDYNKKKLWQLSIRASDMGAERRSSIAIVNIRINDVNDHAPDISLKLFQSTPFIEPRVLTRKELNSVNYANSIGAGGAGMNFLKEDVLYVSKSVPRGTALGLVTIIDRDADWNGFIHNCSISLIDSSGSGGSSGSSSDGNGGSGGDAAVSVPILLLDELFHSSTSSPLLSFDSNLNLSVDAHLNAELNGILKSLDFVDDNSGQEEPDEIKKPRLFSSANGRSANGGSATSSSSSSTSKIDQTPNKKKYLLRLNVDYANKPRKRYFYELEISASDKGLNKPLIGKKRLKLIVANELYLKRLNNDIYANNYDAEDDLTRGGGSDSDERHIVGDLFDEEENREEQDETESLQEEIDQEAESIMSFRSDHTSSRERERVDDEESSQGAISEAATDEYLFAAKSTYKVNINENNPYPIELVKINSSELEMATTTSTAGVRYELMLPFESSERLNASTRQHQYLHQQHQQQQNHNAHMYDNENSYGENSRRQGFGKRRMKLMRCSAELLNHLSIDAYNGLVMLNKSLDREHCSSYLFVVRCTDLIDARLSSLVYLKINVNDLNDNGPKFEQHHYVFYIMEKTTANTSSNLIRVQDPDLRPRLDYRIELLSGAGSSVELEHIRSHFGIVKAARKHGYETIKLLIKKPLSYEHHQKYTFNLIVSEPVETVQPVERSNAQTVMMMDSQPLRSDICLIEINVLDSSDSNAVAIANANANVDVDEQRRRATVLIDRLVPFYEISLMKQSQAQLTEASQFEQASHSSRLHAIRAIGIMAMNISKMHIDDYMIVINVDILKRIYETYEMYHTSSRGNNKRRVILLKIKSNYSSETKEDNYEGHYEGNENDNDNDSKNDENQNQKLNYMISKANILEINYTSSNGSKNSSVSNRQKRSSTKTSKLVKSVSNYTSGKKLILKQQQQHQRRASKFVELEAPHLNGGLFLLNQSNGVLEIELDRLNSFNSLPIIVHLAIKVEAHRSIRQAQKSEYISPLPAHTNLRFIIVNNATSMNKIVELNSLLLVDRHAAATAAQHLNRAEHESFNEQRKSTGSGNEKAGVGSEAAGSIDSSKQNKSKYETFKEMVLKLQLPFIILSSLLVLLAVALVTLFVLSIIYSVSMCRLFNVCKCECCCGDSWLDNSEQQNETGGENEPKMNYQQHSSIGSASTASQLIRFCSLLCKNNRNSFGGAATICLDDAVDETDRKRKEKKRRSTKSNSSAHTANYKSSSSSSYNMNEADEKSKPASYLLDSPIVIRKLYENNDVETQKKYLKKYHLEYLFDDVDNTLAERSINAGLK
jgi:hypothetical protein